MRLALLLVLACSEPIERLDAERAAGGPCTMFRGVLHGGCEPRRAAGIDLRDRRIDVVTTRNEAYVSMSIDQPRFEQRMYVLWLVDLDGVVVAHVPLLRDDCHEPFGCHDSWGEFTDSVVARDVVDAVVSDEGFDATAVHDHDRVRDTRMLQLGLLGGQRAPRGPSVAHVRLAMVANPHATK
jgi:hypothetical protein